MAAIASRKGSRRRTMNDINMVPFIDVMLVLLIIFMVAAPMLQRGIDVKLPVASRSQEIASERLFVSVPASYQRDQRVFLGYAQVWRYKAREETARQRILTDPHSPPEFRVNGAVRNVDAWYAAMDVKQGEKLFLAPGERVRLW